MKHHGYDKHFTFADVTIHQVPNKVNFEQVNSSSSFVLDIPKVAEFYIQHGRDIAYKPYPDVAQDELRLYLLGSCMGALLQQRGLIVLHGNAITWDNETCTMFVGESGAGKSTTAAWHYLQGASLVADDVCAIAFNKAGHPVVLPSYPQIKLWQASADVLGISTQNLRRVRKATDKFIFPVTDRFATKPCLIKKIVEIDPEGTSQQAFVGVEKLLKLQQHSYRYYFLSKMGLEPLYVQQLMRLASQIELETMPRIKIDTLTRETMHVES